ncbi:MAG: DNA polymerase III, partial [Candidatus Rokubacteria bacterium]|nr:DNA polymerase III [Candidatus Rokubacteria bacterium]
MRNFEVARAFSEIADLLELREASVFRIRAYRRAAENLESLTEDVEAIAARGELETIPGIGKDLAAKIQECLTTGKIADLEALHREIPAGVVTLMGIQGLGPKTAKLLFEKLGVDSIEKLEAVTQSGKILQLPGIKEKTRQNILKGITTWKAGQARMPLGKALPLAQALIHALNALPEVREIEVAGSIRRMKDTVGDIDLLVTSTRSALVMERFVALPAVAQVLMRGETKSSIRHREGIQVDLRVVDPEAFGAALQYFTGSQAHNIRLRELASRKGLKISEYGVFNEKTGKRIAGKTEEEVYRAVGLPWIPPELREDRGEIEAAVEGTLPSLIELSQIRGDLHAHTDWSDGHHPLPALIEAAEARGYEYIIVSDHSRSSPVARGLTPEQLREQI